MTLLGFWLSSQAYPVARPAGADESQNNLAEKQRPPLHNSSSVDAFEMRLERLRTEDPGAYEKVKALMKVDREAAAQFLQERFAKGPDTKKGPALASDSKSKQTRQFLGQKSTLLPPQPERFATIDTLSFGEFSVGLCQRKDGAFGLGEIRRGQLPLRTPQYLITWQVDGQLPEFESLDGLIVKLKNPPATLTFTAEARECGGTTWTGFKMHFQAEHGPIVETASWELGGSTRGLSYFDGYRGWHAPPGWQQADAVPPTNPKLMPGLLAGTGFQFEHGADGALLHFHTTTGDRLRNASRGETLEFKTWFPDSASVERFILTANGDSRVNLWTRAYEMTHAELRHAFGLSEPEKGLYLQWPPFSRRGFAETAHQCAEVTAREGFAGASIDVIWDNADFHGGAKNMNIWDYTICDGYGGESALEKLVAACKRRDLRVMAWVPAGHLWSQSPVWKTHPDWILLDGWGETFVNPSGGIWHGSLEGGFRQYWRDQVTDVVRQFGLDGLWLDTHLSYAQQLHLPAHGTALAETYRDFNKAGAHRLLVEGDASVFGSYAIAIGDDWKEQWGKIPDPDLYYGATLAAGSMNPRFYLKHFRRYVAAGAPWIMNWDFLFSQKLSGPEIDEARKEIREVVQAYGRVSEGMVHRFVHADGSGYTWTNDRDNTKIVWLLQDARLSDGRKGKSGEVYVMAK